MSTDHADITAVMQKYIDGAARGDANLIREAFHPTAYWHGVMHGTDYAMNFDDFIAYVDGQPCDDGSFVATIESITQDATTARVVVTETGDVNGMEFRDYFSLVNYAGTWKIVNKTFVLTN
jgi:hypothetical protein